MSDTEQPQFVVVAGLYDRRSRAGNKMLAGRADATHAGPWGVKGAMLYVFYTAGGGYALYVKTHMASDMTLACYLQERQSTSGKRVLFGVFNGVRLYILPQPRERRPKDSLPDFEVTIRIEDYDVKVDGPPSENAK